MAGEMIKIAKADDLPTIAVSGNYNYWADHFAFGKNNWESFYSFNLVLNIPIFNGFQTPAKVAEAQATIREIDLTQKGLVNNIKFEVQAAYLTLNHARESLAVPGEEHRAAQESVRVAELNYGEGLITITRPRRRPSRPQRGPDQLSPGDLRLRNRPGQLEKAVGLNWKSRE